jgi:uncharacterized protein YgbK (DUF1537 family)
MSAAGLKAPLIGCIADDSTGATDLAGMLVSGGLDTVQTIGVPDTPLGSPSDAVVVALKSRTIPAGDAVAMSLSALSWLRAQGCERIYFKYCSTFDSTDRGNIGPVTDALLDALDCGTTLACPALPEMGRTVFRGHLFVGDRLLSRSGMEHHPLNPMREPNLVEVLQRQTAAKVGLLRYDAMAAGPEEVRRRLDRLEAEGVRIAIADAISQADLLVLGSACAQRPLLTGGSGLGFGVACALSRAGNASPNASPTAPPAVAGGAAVIAGSCSSATAAQVADWSRSHSAFCVDPLRLAAGAPVVDEALRFARRALPDGPVLVYSTAPPKAVQAVQASLGAGVAGAMVEQAMGAIACGLRELGVRRFVIAGGETAGAVVAALGVKSLRIGPQIDPGVPWTSSLDGERLALALKSGNFGAPDFFRRALAMLESADA